MDSDTKIVMRILLASGVVSLLLAALAVYLSVSGCAARHVVGFQRETTNPGALNWCRAHPKVSSCAAVNR
jgi:hypothetical protein